MKVMMKKALIYSAVLAPIFAGIMVTITMAIIFYTPYNGDKIQFSIKPGEGFSSINYKLDKAGLIGSARLFHYYTRYNDSMNKFKAGTYEIAAGNNMGDILVILTKGTPILTKVMIPEGKNMYEIGKILEAKEITTYDAFIRECKSKKAISALGINAPSVEGYLFPDTYKFAPKTPAKTVIAAMTKLFRDKTKGIPLDSYHLTKHEIIILASIVEKETGAKVERPTIAGVYLNRLKKRMRLQADPTTIYGIWESYNGNLRRKHLLQKTDYNTYKMSGLPLGPIANPSLAAIKAVLKPNSHSFIYFVSKNDGTHVFTSTYKEHLRAVDYWQKNRRNRKGKSWRDLKQ